MAALDINKYIIFSLYSFLALSIIVLVFFLLFKMPTAKTTSKKQVKAGTKTPIKKHTLTIHGFEGCGYFAAALTAAKTYKKNYPGITLEINPVPRNLWEGIIKSYALAKGIIHKTSPLIFYDNKYVGGHDAFIIQLKKSVPFS
jgi:hypothetical protein